MNLFWLDTDPVLAAQAHQDIHVGKMLLEAVQLLCTAFPQPATFWLSWYRPVWQFAAAGHGAQVQTQDVGLAVYKYLGGE